MLGGPVDSGLGTPILEPAGRRISGMRSVGDCLARIGRGLPLGRNEVKLSLILRTDPEPVIMVTATGFTLTYRPTTEVPPGCD